MWYPSETQMSPNMFFTKLIFFLPDHFGIYRKSGQCLCGTLNEISKRPESYLKLCMNYNLREFSLDDIKYCGNAVNEPLKYMVSKSFKTNNPDDSLMMLGDTFINFVLYGFRDSTLIIIQSYDVFW